MFAVIVSTPQAEISKEIFTVKTEILLFPLQAAEVSPHTAAEPPPGRRSPDERESHPVPLRYQKRCKSPSAGLQKPSAHHRQTAPEYYRKRIRRSLPAGDNAPPFAAPAPAGCQKYTSIPPASTDAGG